MVQNPIMYETLEGAGNILVLEASEVKFPALEGFILPTDIHGSRGT